MGRYYGQCPAVVLLHLRRLDRFLKHHGLHHTAHTLEKEAKAFFDAPHLQRLVMEGQWNAAERYLDRFSSLWTDDDHVQREYSALLGSLCHNAMLAVFVCRGEEGGRYAATLEPPDDAYRKECPGSARRQDIYRSMASQQARESIDWDGIKRRTVQQLQRLLHLRPNMERMRLPQYMPTPSDILPLSSRGRRNHPRKGVRRRPAHDLAKFLLQKRLTSTKEISHSGGDQSGASSEAAKS